jgi:ferric-dicitrate binding protein FerR (iron transport regulator)
LIALVIRSFGNLPARPAVLTHTYATVAGQTATVLLQDGSSVTLGPATSLHLSTGDRQRATVATVVGEAFFVIAHHSAAPLLVRTGMVEAQVLGTSFGVRQYRDESSAHIAVTEGRVAIRGRRDGVMVGTSTVLTMHALAQIDDSGQVRLLPETAVDEYTGWTAGRLVFHGAPLRNVIADLARTYGADIRVTDSLLAKQPVTLTASVSVDPLPAVLDFLARAADAHWERVHGTLLLMPGRAASTIPLPSHFPTLEKHYGR